MGSGPFGTASNRPFVKPHLYLRKLISRLGNAFSAPDWFVAALPKDLFLDGELWCGRKLFQKTMSIVRSSGGNHMWKQIKYKGTFYIF
jgi:hypothetical protein